MVLPCPEFTTVPLFHALPAEYLRACAARPLGQALSRTVLTFYRLSGATPLLTTMSNYKLASSRPAQAVGYPAQGRGTDGDGGPTAGRPLAGGGAVSASGNQSHETPPPVAPLQSASGSNHYLRGPGPPPSSACAPRNGPHGRVGSPPAGPKPAALVSPVRLKPRKFRFGTWNMRGRVSTLDNKRVPKSVFAEELLLLEQIDVLVLTETHSLDYTHSRRVRLLAQSDSSDRSAGVAFISRADGGWSCLDTKVLIPGYAVLVKLHHKRSTESFWLLGVYGDTSSSLTNFYSSLLLEVASAIDSIPDWTGCFAAGDWNFVSHPEDHSPPGSSSVPRSILRNFDLLMDLCLMKDVAGSGAFPSGWTHEMPNNNGIHTRSRIDRIYCPADNWFPDDPVSIPNLWSDHALVWADCVLSRPCVQMAVPADRLPPVDRLDKIFWKEALASYSELSTSPITLISWTAFKQSVLASGLSSKSRASAAKGKNWLPAFRGDQLSPEEFESALSWLHRKPNRADKWQRRRRWPAAAPEYDTAPSVVKPSWRPSSPNPWSASTIVKPLYITPSQPPPSPPSPAAPPDPAIIKRAILRRMLARRKAAKQKFEFMETHHTSAWYNLSSNKEADERGSHASISVSGLRLSPNHKATPVLGEMVQVARSYFYDLHTPEPSSSRRLLAQSALLNEVFESYSGSPAPADVPSGPFVRAEVAALSAHMPNTAPGPDGIPYSFWKSLASRVADFNSSSPKEPLLDFWDAFLDLANEVKTNGSSRCRFKDANISMFFKKGDPTLSSNYRPISSMNTDCKLYTNLVNNWLSPWAIAKLHPDQKGFVPGRFITDHTRLAYEVAHLADRTGTNGFLVSLDQAKAYDRVDHRWLMSVLTNMCVDADLRNTIADIISSCHSRVRINGGYSSRFSLRRGVRQGDPLSCLLFNFSIEPLAMRLRASLAGFSVHGLPPVKVLFYADDVNMFLSLSDSVPAIVECLNETSFAIGSKFNHDKTDVKPLGSSGFVQRCYDTKSLDGQLLPGAFVLAPDSPLRVLGVWVASPNRANERWLQLLSHIRRLIVQWNNIGASLPNRVLIAKALLLSRCYWLLDGNGIPRFLLNKVSNTIMRFVRGKNSNAPYSLLEPPLSLGGLNCPSLVTRKAAYDLKLICDLITGPSSAPWKVWMMYDLGLSTAPDHRFARCGLNPFLQNAHTRFYFRTSGGTSQRTMSDRLADAFRTARSVGIDPRCSFPSKRARLDYPILCHPALPKISTGRSHDRLKELGITTVGDLFFAPRPRLPRPIQRVISRLLALFSVTPWDPSFADAAPSATLNVWPAMRNPSGCIRFLSHPYSIVTTSEYLLSSSSKFKPYLLPRTPCVPAPLGIQNVHLWVGTVYASDGPEVHSAGASWVSNWAISSNVSLTGLPLSAKMACLASVVFALFSWPSGNITIHTDSSFVTHLASGGLLSLERDGWPSFPWLSVACGPRPVQMTALFQYFLYLLRSHVGSISFSLSSPSRMDHKSKSALALAAEGRHSYLTFDLSRLSAPSGWIDNAPVLNHQSLSFITSALVSRLPAPIISRRLSDFSDRWTVFMWFSFSTKVDLGAHIRKLGI